MDLYVPKDKNRNNPYIAPVVANDLSNQPKTLIITADFDPLRDEGEAFGEKLIAFKNEVVMHRLKDSLHGFLTFPTKAKCLTETYTIINRFFLFCTWRLF